MKTKQLHRVALALIGMGLSVSVWAEPLIVKIGSAAPKTGAIAHLGNDNENGALLAIHEINAKGNLTIAGQKVVLQLVGEDDEADPRMGSIVAQKLVDAGVVAVVGHLNSGASIPANRIYSKYGMVQISPSSTNPDYTIKSNRTPKGHVSAYRVVAHDGLQGVALAKYLTQVDGIKRVAILDDGTQYGQGLAEDFARRLVDSKIKVVSYNQATDKTTDFQSYLKEINSLKAQVVFWGGMDDTGARLVRQMRQRDMNMPLIAGDGVCTSLFVKSSGAAGVGTLCSQSGFLPLSEMKQGDKFSNNYEQMFEGQEVQIYAPFAYDAVYAIVEAMKIANSTEREAITAAMPKVDFEGVTGRIHFDSRGDIINGPITIFKVKNQRLEVETIVR
jgi:branched-chain amino acid transport system substrate-binding protein